MWLPGWNCPNCKSQDAGGTVLEDRAVYPYRIFKVTCARCTQPSLWAYKESFAGWLRILAGTDPQEQQVDTPTDFQVPPRVEDLDDLVADDNADAQPALQIPESEISVVRRLLAAHRGPLTDLF
ncbi:MAG: hypothetical protein ACYDAY_05705 [Candidatus Dormibacteria bacterium]